MTTDSPDREHLFRSVLSDYRSTWRSLVLTDVAFKLVAFVVLTPLASLLFRGLLAVSGRAALSDMDILLFFIGPYGWLCFVALGAIWLAIVALELASLTAIVDAQNAEQHLRPLGALRFAAAKAGPTIQVAARMVGLTLLVVAPFLAIAAVVYVTLLTEYDINFYLKEKPPVFIAAVSVGAVLGAALVAILLRLFSGWFFALPLVLFEGVAPRDALRTSGQRVAGHRRTVLLWIVGWFAATAVLSSIVTVSVGLIGRAVLPKATESLNLLAIAVGSILSVWAIAGLAVNLFSTTTFAVIMYRPYRRFGCKPGCLLQPLALTKGASDEPGLRVTRMQLLVGGVVGVLFAVGAGAVAVKSVHVEDDVQIMAHRGSSKAAPENTMASIQQAIDDGADWVEIDVQETADGEVVVFHDSDFMKTAGRDLKIWDTTVDDLRDIDVGSWFSKDFNKERVPTLGEVLAACQGRIGVNIELKYYGRDEQLEQRVADIVAAHDMDSQVKAMSLKIDGVRKMKSIRPDWPVGLLMSVSAGSVEDIEADFLAVNASFATRRLVRDAHANDKEIYVWTVNDAPTMSAMVSRGVDGLLTDKPALAHVVLEERAKMSPPERLLLELAGVLGVTPELGEP